MTSPGLPESPGAVALAVVTCASACWSASAGTGTRHGRSRVGRSSPASRRRTPQYMRRSMRPGCGSGLLGVIGSRVHPRTGVPIVYVASVPADDADAAAGRQDRVTPAPTVSMFLTVGRHCRDQRLCPKSRLGKLNRAVRWPLAAHRAGPDPAGGSAAVPGGAAAAGCHQARQVR